MRSVVLVLSVAALGVACVDLTPPVAVTCGDGACADPGETGSSDAEPAPGADASTGAAADAAPGTDAPPATAGAACADDGECASGFCEQGVCCRSSCASLCQSCALPDTAGTCSPAPAGQDPLGQCEDRGAASCGTDGTCNGAGACRLYLPGAACQPPSCAAGMATPGRTCDGSGTCQPAAPAVPCASNACASDGTCLERCAGKDDCAAGAACIDGTCVTMKERGQRCTANAECVSGACAQGVCCDRACAGACMACDSADSVGTCAPVKAGEDPRNDCADDGAAACGKDGACDGAGACRLYAAGTSCTAPACASGIATPARTCDGKGLCQPGVVLSCGRAVCGAGDCVKTCATNNDCVPPSVCTEGACGGLTAQYYDGKNFETLALLRVDGNVNFDWVNAAPDPTVPPNLFSVRWTGRIIPRFSETYALYAKTDDGVRLWVDGVLLIDRWGDAPIDAIATVPLVAGRAHDLKMEMRDNTGRASAQLSWYSPSQPREVVPPGQLVPVGQALALPRSRVYEAEVDFKHQTGKGEADGWAATPGVDSAAFLLYDARDDGWGDAAVGLTYRVMIDMDPGTSDPLLTLDVLDKTAGGTVVRRDLRRTDFGAARTYVDITMRVDLTGRYGHSMETRAHWPGRAYVRVDRVTVSPAR